MRYPCLVPERLCNTEIHVELNKEGVDKYGEEYPAIIFDKKCNFQDKSKTIFTAEKKVVQVTGTAMFPGDIAPELATISGGTVTVFGCVRYIVQGTKARNPDGTVNFCQLEVI